MPPVSCPLYTYASPNANIKPEYLDNIHIDIVAVMCGTPPNGINTVPVPSSVNLVYQQTYEYMCLPNAELSPPDVNVTTTCLADGSFSLDPLPNCTCK